MSAAGGSSSGGDGKLSPIPNAKPFRPGFDPRRYMGGPLSPAERQFRQYVEQQEMTKAAAIMRKVRRQGILDLAAGNPKTIELWFKLCGLIKKPTDDAQIQAAARGLLEAMLAEARSHREAVAQGPAAQPNDVGTEE